MTWLLLAGAILVEVAATLCLRIAATGPRRWYAPVVVGYLASFTLLYVALLGGLPIGIAYGVWAASGVAITAIAARVLFKEPLTRLMIVGIVTIMVGVLLVELGAQERSSPADTSRIARGICALHGDPGPSPCASGPPAPPTP